MKYIRFTVKLLPIAFLYLSLQGCIGIGILGIGDRSRPTGSVLNFYSKSILVHNQGQPLRADHVRSQWGEPDYRGQIDGGSENWEYRGKNLRWHGFVPMILLPLPLVVPFGHDYVTFVIRNGQVQSTKTTDSSITFVFYCGYAMFISELIGQRGICYIRGEN